MAEDYAELDEDERQPLYPMVISFIKKQESDVPVRIASEWIRSRRFIFYQEKINFTFKEAKTLQLSLVTARANGLSELAKVLDNYGVSLAKERSESIEAIEDSLDDINKRMYRQLSNVMVNCDLIDAEIFEGAGKDIVWLNANPDFKKWSVKNDKQARELATEPDKLGFGMDYELSGESELWQDEMGTLRAVLVNRCTQKEKYLAIRARKPQFRKREEK